MKVISIFLALINSLLAGLLITFLVTSTDFKISVAWWSAVRIMLAFFIILVGLLSWISMVAPIRPALLALGSLFLVGLGPATMVWAFHKASLTGLAAFARKSSGSEFRWMNLADSILPITLNSDQTLCQSSYAIQPDPGRLQ